MIATDRAQRFDEKVVLVTGSTRGIGLDLARAFIAEGAKVVVCGTNQATVDKVVAELGEQAAGIQANVASATDVTALIGKATEQFGRLDVLINNAGVTKDNLLIRMKEEDWDTVLDINLKGAFLVTKAASRIMMKQRHGRIINISSVVGLGGNAGQANYSASKAGLIGLTKSAARELASRNITVNAVAPGFIETDMTVDMPESVKETFFKQIALGCFGSPEDVSSAVLFLASDEAKYITGQVLTVDGGMTM